VIAARRRDQRSRAGRAAFQLIDKSEAAAHLEGAGRIVVLMFDDDLGPESPRQQRPAKRRRRRDGLVHEGEGGFEFVEGEHRLAGLVVGEGNRRCERDAIPPRRDRRLQSQRGAGPEFAPDMRPLDGFDVSLFAMTAMTIQTSIFPLSSITLPISIPASSSSSASSISLCALPEGIIGKQFSF